MEAAAQGQSRPRGNSQRPEESNSFPLRARSRGHLKRCNRGHSWRTDPIARQPSVRICFYEASPEKPVLSHAVQAASLPLASQRPPSERIPLWQLLILAGALVWLYAPILLHLVGQWMRDPNYSHGFFVPAFSLYLLWQGRDRLRSLPLQPSWSGLMILGLALLVLMAGVLGAELFLSRSSLLIALAGLTVLMFGWNHLRAVIFPLAFLLFMIPIPTIVFNQITFPLQLLASKVAAVTLPVLGVPVLREGNIIQLPAMALEVAEACSGIRSLMSLATLAVIYGYLLERRALIRVLLVLAAIPIAVAANSLRIVGTGLLVQYWDPTKAEGFFHAFSGWLIFVVSLLLLFLIHRALQIAWPQGDAR
jgi:exosortase